MLVFLSLIAGAIAASRCIQTPTTINCTHQEVLMPGVGRKVYFQTPLTPPPASGYPVVFLFQGSFAYAELFWHADKSGIDKVFNAYAQTEVVKSLLDNGFVVLTPDAPAGLFWETNIPPWDADWKGSSDDRFMLEMFDHIQNETTFGKCDFHHLFASGISSGGYMTSRVAVSLVNYFRAVVVESGSYMICGGPACEVPGALECRPTGGLPLNHPPTLFLHGLIDPVVPYWTMELYHHALEHQATPTAVVTCDTCDHQWIPQAPKVLLPWFQKYYDWTYTGNYTCPPSS